MKKKVICHIAGLFFFLSSIAQGVDYKPKALSKALEKLGIDGWSSIQAVDSPQSEEQDELLNGQFFRVKEHRSSDLSYIYVGRVNSCRSGVCIREAGVSEYFDYYILFDQDIAVREIKIFNYQASHGHGVMAKGWLRQFVGYSAHQPLKVNKQIDAIAGATISVNAIVADVEENTKRLKHINEILF